MANDKTINGGINQMNTGNLSQQALISKCFMYLNSFKRHRALANINRLERNIEKANFHELKAYQLADSLELGLRALQKGLRDMNELNDDNDND